MNRHTSPERLRQLRQRGGITPANVQEGPRVEQIGLWLSGRRARPYDPVDRRPQVGGADWFGQEVVHAGRQAALAVLLPRARRQGDDGQMAPCRPLPLTDRPDDLEAVQL